jgi:hypothetical protein
MRNSTRFIATIAAGGVVAGGAFALWQAPGSPKTTKTAVSQTAGNADSDAAMQSLVAEGTRLHAAVDAARTQLSQLTDASAPVDQATFALQAQQLAAAKAALAAAEQSLAADEALLAQLRGTAPRTPGAAAKQAVTAPREVRPTSYAPPPAPQAVTPTDNWQPPAQQTSSRPTTSQTPSQTQTRSSRPSSTPTQTNGGGDD